LSNSVRRYYGAIADSVNYTAEELRKLVARITAAADQIANATRDADVVSKGLLDATQKQRRRFKARKSP